MRYLPAFILVLLISAPFSAFASTPKPSCDLTVTTPRGETSSSKKMKVMLAEGESVKLSWASNDATKAKSDSDDSIALSGSQTLVATDDATYSYTFSAGSRKVTCEADIKVATAGFDADSLTNASTRPTLTGTAEGTKSVHIMISQNDGGSHTVYTSKDVRVRGGEWSLKLTKTLDTGSYQITLYGDKAYKLNELASGTLGIGVAGSAGGSSSGTLSASSLPLLTGGSVGASGSVPVAYLKLVNSSKAPATIAGVRLMQNGSAPVSSVIGFTTVDDKAVSRTTVGGSEGTTPFKNGLAYVPLNAVIAPGTLRIFTIKAQLSRNLSGLSGKTLMLDVSSLDTAAKTSAFFPIRGTTWTISGY